MSRSARRSLYYVEFKYGTTPWMRDNLVNGVSQGEATDRALRLSKVHDGVRIRHRGRIEARWRFGKRWHVGQRLPVGRVSRETR